MQCFWNPRKVARSHAFYYLLNIHVLSGYFYHHLYTVGLDRLSFTDLNGIVLTLTLFCQIYIKKDELLHETFSFMNMNEHEYKA